MSTMTTMAKSDAVTSNDNDDVYINDDDDVDHDENVNDDDIDKFEYSETPLERTRY